MGLTLVTPAAAFPVTLTEAKAQCRVSDDSEDTFLNGLIAAATDHVQHYCGRSIITQTWRLTLPAFEDEILLPKGPVASATVAYYDQADADQSFTGFALDTADGRILKDADWPATATRFDAVRITYVAGAAAAPAAIKHAILLLIGHWFMNREAVGDAGSEVPMTVDALLANYRLYGF